jgi:hypothetical protein
MQLPPAIQALCASPHALPGAQDLLPEDVRVPAMLGEFTQGVQVDPPQRERSQVVPRQHVIEAEAGGGPPGRLARPAVRAADGLDGLLFGEEEGLGG